MASILDNAILVGKEGSGTYGTAATLTRAYEGKADSFKRSQEFLSSVGFRSGLQAQLSTRSVAVNMGGEGTLEVDVQSTGFGLLFQSMLGTVAGPTQIAATDAYESTFETDADGPTDSWTVQVQRVDASGTVRSFTHLGSVMTGWSLSQEVDGLLAATFNFDFRDVNTSTSAGTPAYVDDLPYAWTQSAATWNSAAIDLKSWSLDADLGFKTDRRFLIGSALKKKPVRASVPTFEGSAEIEFDGLDEYEAFVAGTIAPMTIKWTGGLIESGHNFELEVNMRAVQFQGTSPEVSLDDMPKQELPYKVLYDGEDPAITITYKSDSATH